MNLWCQMVAVRELVRDTFRQAFASGIGWMMLAVTAVCAALCLSAGVSGDATLRADDEPALFLPSPSAAAAPGTASFNADPEHSRREGVETIRGRLTLAFGAVSVPLGRERADAVHFLELFLAGGVAGTLGLLLALVWTAGFVPTFLEPSAASVLLAKPVARPPLLLGKFAGVMVFVAAQVILFVGATWLALGARTGVWDATYWWCVPLLLLQFATYYSFSVLLAVVTRSTVACVFGSALYWLLAWGINYGRTLAHGVLESHSLPPCTRALAEVAYWIFPKPIDAGLVLFNVLGARDHFGKPITFGLLEANGAFSPQWSLASSLALTVVLLAVAAREFQASDY